MTAGVSHLGWRPRAILAYRLRVIRAAAQDSVAFPSLQATPEFHGAVTTAYAKVADPAAPGGGSVPRLEEFFERSRRTLDIASPQSALPPAFRPFREALSAELGASTCQTCSTRPCEGTDASEVADLEAVTLGGLCIGPLHTFFAFADDLARRHYEQRPKLNFHTAELTAHPGRPLEIALDGKTLEKARFNPGAIEREVVLRLFVGEYGIDDYFATPYVLFHEIFCHGYAGTSIAEEIVGDVYSDGWMDWIAANTLTREFVAGSVPADLRPFARDMSAHTDAVSRRRFHPSDGSASLAYHLDLGRRAAQKLTALLAGCLGSDSAGWTASVRFSVAFHGSDASDALRAALVDACNELIQGLGPVDTLAASHPAVVSAVQRYLHPPVGGSTYASERAKDLAFEFKQLHDSAFS